MKTITLSFNKDIDEYPEIKNIIDDLESKFEIIEDDDSFDLLRYVTIKGESLMLGINDCLTTISHYSKPHIFTSIYNKYLYCVKVNQ